jgi:ribosomal protein S18 acetylase RimI-like enzyme
MAEAKLVEMTTEEFERRRGWMIRQHAERLADLGGVPLPDALARAERDVMRFFPETPRTPGRLLRTAWADGEEIGCVWATVLGLVPPAAWIDWIVVDEPHRRRGYGRAILEAMEAELGGLGVSQLGVNVYSSNDVARRLSERLGFEVKKQQRGRSLEGIPGTLDSPVTLVPITSAAFQRRMESYVVAIMSDYGLPAPWAHKRAWRPLEHGLDTEGVFLRAVLADDAEVGWVCYALRHPTIPGTGWIYRLDIDPAFRSRGYGTATVVLVEADLVARGVRRIGTAVPGCNAGAQRLADRLGYALTAQQMSKSLPAVSGR